ncbi:amidohydrolase [Alkalihalobacillus pseudalcaliphilus]|uniref:amidohydrolase n=1 Tax=Alkalihalobacillus pseudalcaliphilus TaxID=79884 RepID=UPI00064DA784|nr:amidohydrolase [Alkalihalobacillus pseudalcaliphilus]KMK74531.1 amidohydrolase [Alkalihalobacillus pseudalcaliphilus]
MGKLWFHATFYTMNKENEYVEALYTEGGLIRDTGTEAELVEKYSEKIEETIDLDGAFAYPGFVDSHLHMIGHGERLMRLDLSHVSSSVEMLQLLLEQKEKADQWIIGEGWNENNFIDRKIFHRMELDEISDDKPMFLTRICRHAALVNSKALEMAGITKDTINPEGGVIVKDAEGEPTGLLLDEAVELVKEVMPGVSDRYIKKALMVSIKDLYKKGLVGGHTEDLAYYRDPLETIKAFDELVEEGELPLRAHLLVNHKAFEKVPYEQLHRSGAFVETGAMKIFADGALGGRTALLSEPYADDPSTSGVAIHNQMQLDQLVVDARNKGMDVAIHVIGDKALEMALTAIERAPRAPGRDRLIHVQVARKDLRERMKKLPVILDIQPRFVASDFPWVQERLGLSRMEESFAWKTLLDEGLICAGGSDAPIEPVDPLLGIHAAVTRKKPTENHQGYQPEQKLSMYEAIQLFTTASAYAIQKEHVAGKLSKGFYADMTILSNDLFKMEPDQILDTEILGVVIAEQRK